MPGAFGSVITGLNFWFLVYPGPVCNGYGAPTRITSRITVRAKLLKFQSSHAGFFHHLTRGRIDHLFVRIDKTTGKTPSSAKGFVLATDKQDIAPDNKKDVCSEVTIWRSVHSITP